MRSFTESQMYNSDVARAETCYSIMRKGWSHSTIKEICRCVEKSESSTEFVIVWLSVFLASFIGVHNKLQPLIIKYVIKIGKLTINVWELHNSIATEILVSKFLTMNYYCEVIFIGRPRTVCILCTGLSVNSRTSGACACYLFTVCKTLFRRSIWKMLGPFATASRRTPIHQVSLLSHWLLESRGWRCISMPNFVTIGQLVAKIKIFQDGGRCHLGFLKSRNFIGYWSPEGRDASACQISSQSVNQLRRY